MVTAKPVRTDFGECGGGQQVLLHSPGYQQVESSPGTSGGQCGQLKHQYMPGDDRMEKLLLTVCGRPQTCSVSVGRDCISGSTPSSTTR
jgi:hypothetical protein